MLEKLDQIVDSLSDSVDRISKSSKNIIKVLILWPFISGTILLTYLGFSNKDNIVPFTYDYIKSKNDRNTLLIDDPWYFMDSSDFPLFFVDSDGNACTVQTTQGCFPDLDKKYKLTQVLSEINKELGSIRSLISVYGPTKRHIAVQVANKGYQDLGKEYWAAPIAVSQYRKNIEMHQQGLCNTWITRELPDESFLKKGAARYSTAFSMNCPLNNDGVVYNVTGYLSADFRVELNEKQISEVEAVLKEKTKIIEQIIRP